jgi:copper chaperone CopZ
MLPLKLSLTAMQISDPASISPNITQTTVLNVSSMHCDDCVQAVKTQLLQQPGVIAATVNLTNKTAVVERRTDVNPVELADCLTQAGFPSQLQTSESIHDQPQTSLHWSLLGFFILVVGFNFCLIAQVLTVGLAYFYNPQWWNAHVWLVWSYSGFSLILLIWAYRITLPRRVRSLTASLPVLLGLQFLSIHLKTPIPLAIAHPLIGFTLFSVSTTLVHRVSRFLFPRQEEAL